MNLSYCHEKLSLALFEMCVSTQSLKNRLRISVRHGLTFFSENDFPEGLREQFSEIKLALAGVSVSGRIDDSYPDPVDRMKPSQAQRLLNEIISLREGVAREYYRRAFRDRASGAENKSTATENITELVTKLMGR
jgi:hypothetical protein